MKQKNKRVILEQAIFLKEAITLHSGACNEFNWEPWRGSRGLPGNTPTDPIRQYKAVLNIVWDNWSFIVTGTMNKS